MTTVYAVLYDGRLVTIKSDRDAAFKLVRDLWAAEFPDTPPAAVRDDGHDLALFKRAIVGTDAYIRAVGHQVDDESNVDASFRYARHAQEFRTEGVIK